MKNLLVAFVLAATMATAQDFSTLTKQTKVFKLKNGLTIIVAHRGDVPVFSYYAIVDAGSADDPEGLSGLAHMMEHMAFKGTESIGSKDWKSEQQALTRLEDVSFAYERRQKEHPPDGDQELARLKMAFNSAVTEADRYSDGNRISDVIEEAGGQGLNATTSMDETSYFYSLPSSKLDLWAKLESQRFQNPVMRGFYHERDVVLEERLTRIENRPLGHLMEELLATAYSQHPYGHPGMGTQAGVGQLTAAEAYDFFSKYYVPSNTTIAIVGDVNVSRVRALARQYFAKLPAKKKPLLLDVVEPKQIAEHSYVEKRRSGSIYVEGYHRPACHDPSDPVLAVMANLLFDGRGARMNSDLVEQKRVATTASGFDGLPGRKYPSLFGFYVVPAAGHSIHEVQSAVQEEIDRLRTENVSEEELSAAKMRIKTRVVRDLTANTGIARELATYQVRYGSWKQLFTWLDQVDRITETDVRNVAARTFMTSNRTIAVLESTADK